MAFDAGAIVARIKATADGIKAGINEAKGQLDGFESKAKNVSKSMGDIGKGMSKYVTAPLVGLGTAAVMTVSKFDDSMSKVQAISGATGDELGKLRDLAKELGSTTAHSASAAADAMGYLALAGWDTNQILAATPDMLSLATAASMDLATAADIVSDTMSAFQMDAERAEEAADIFAAASSNANTDVQMLGEAMKYAGAAANAAEMDLAQTSTILGILADSGIKGSMAGTTFAAMLSDMKNAAEDGTLAVGNMTISLYEADGSMRDMGTIMAEMEHATKDMTTAQRDAALANIFQQRSIRGANILLSTGTERYNELEAAIYDSSGAAADMAETMGDNIGGAFRQLRSQMEGILIQLGEQLVPIIREQVAPALQQFGDFLSRLIDWYTELSPEMQKWVNILLVAVVAAGPVLIVLSKIIGLIGALAPLFGVLKAAMLLLTGPVGIIVAAIAGLIAILVHLYNTNEEFRDGVNKIWDQVKEIFNLALEFIKYIISVFVEWAKWYWETYGEYIIAQAKVIWDTITGIFNGAVKVIRGILDFFIGLFTGDWERMGEGLKRIWSGLWQAIESIVRGAWGLLRNAFELVHSQISSWFNNLRGQALQWGKNMISGFVDGIRSMGSAVADAARGVVNRAADFIRFWSPAKEGEGRFVAQWGENMIEGFLGGVRNAIPDVIDTFDHVTAIMSGFSMPTMNMHGAGEQQRSIMTSFERMFERMFQGANIYVRSDEDIKKIAREIFGMFQSTARGRGVLTD